MPPRLLTHTFHFIQPLHNIAHNVPNNKHINPDKSYCKFKVSAPQFSVSKDYWYYLLLKNMTFHRSVCVTVRELMAGLRHGPVSWSVLIPAVNVFIYIFADLIFLLEFTTPYEHHQACRIKWTLQVSQTSRRENWTMSGGQLQWHYSLAI